LADIHVSLFVHLLKRNTLSVLRSLYDWIASRTRAALYQNSALLKSGWNRMLLYATLGIESDPTLISLQQRMN
jgi:hypothetical protein